jgi:SAM-dependent methyltransferase
MGDVTHEELAVILSDEHLRERITPMPGDNLYLHLSDLRLALEAHATGDKLDILDFGAGISPYRSLFPSANYLRADFAIEESNLPDYVLNESLVVDAPDNSFDIILSTQVLEHVEDPLSYLMECLRLLRPHGKLILSTHGTYADHPCPGDYHRWTGDGLALICREAGFEAPEVFKLTVGPRALLFLYDMYGRQLHRRAFSFFSAVFALYYRFHVRVRRQIHRWADAFFANCRVVPNQAGTNDIYINLLVQATKPEDSKQKPVKK